MASAFALFISAGIYAAIFAYLYWDRYVNIDRKLDLKRYNDILLKDGCKRKNETEISPINKDNFNDKAKCSERAKFKQIKNDGCIKLKT